MILFLNCKPSSRSVEVSPSFNFEASASSARSPSPKEVCAPCFSTLEAPALEMKSRWPVAEVERLLRFSVMAR